MNGNYVYHVLKERKKQGDPYSCKWAEEVDWGVEMWENEILLSKHFQAYLLMSMLRYLDLTFSENANVMNDDYDNGR